jgi:hypothetical protein
MHHQPWLGWLFVALAVLFVIKALPFILPLLLVFAIFRFVSHHACGHRSDFRWYDSMDEKPKRKNDDWDNWHDDEPIIV